MELGSDRGVATLCGHSVRVVGEKGIQVRVLDIWRYGCTGRRRYSEWWMQIVGHLGGHSANAAI